MGSGQRFRLGASGFLDGGRLWAENGSRSDLDGDGLGLKWGAGGGPRLRWGESVLLRIDVAYSPSAADVHPFAPVAFYVTFGHAF